MEYEKEQRVKRTQRDYSFAFKMLIVHEVEKGKSLINKLKQNMVFKEDQLCLHGYVSTDNKIGLLKLCLPLQNANLPSTTHSPVGKTISRRKAKN